MMYILISLCLAEKKSPVKLQPTLISKVIRSVPYTKFHTEQMFVSVRVKLRNHVKLQTVKRFKRYKGSAIYARY